MKNSGKLIGLITCLLLTNCAISQYAITKNDTLSLGNDSVLKIAIPEYRGKLKWQISQDNKNWDYLNIQDNDTLTINSDINALYRGEIIDNNCIPIYSDTVKLSSYLFKVNLQLPTVISGKNVVINSLTDNSKSIGNNYHFINSNSSIIAYDTILNKPLYFGFPGIGESDTFRLNAKETALFLCLSSFPFLRRPAYKRSILTIKQALYEYPEVKTLEKKIEYVIAQKGYLDYDSFGKELGDAINSIITSFNNYTGSPNKISPTVDNSDKISKIAQIKELNNILSPFWNQNYQGWYKVSNNISRNWKDSFDQNTGIYQLKRSFFNQTPSLIGVKIGKADRKTNIAYPEKDYLGFIEPYYPPNLLSVSGNIENIVDFGKSTWDIMQYGFIDGLTQTDAFSSEVELKFELKEGEKDAFVFMGPKDDQFVQALNILYLFLDITSDLLVDENFVNKFLIFMVQNHPVDVSNLIFWWQNGEYDLIIQNIGKRIEEFIISIPDHYKLPKDFEKTLGAFITGGAAVYKCSIIAHKIITMIILSQQNIDVMIPVYFSSDFDKTVPYIITRNTSEITENTASSGGSIISNGGLPITASGVCYSLSPNPEVNAYTPKTIDGAIEGSYISRLTNLLPGKTYYVRSYASNILGPGYGNQVIFTTNPGKPPKAEFTVSSEMVIAGEVMKFTDKSDFSPTGWFWDFGDGSPSSNLKDPVHTYTQAGTFTVTLTATNNFGSNSISKTVTIIKPTILPSVSTSGVESLTQTSAKCGGTVSSDGGAPVTARGVCWNKTGNPTIQDNRTVDGTGMEPFVSNISGLIANTTYYVRAYATNSAGTAYGNQVVFTTAQSVSLPVLTTKTATQVTTSSATCGGNITADGGAPVTARGVCWSTSQNPTTGNSKTTNGSGTGSFTSNITGLTPNTIYYTRAYATNSQGTAYGAQVIFATLSGAGPGKVIDLDGNVYPTVMIGSKEWMAKNLSTTKYRDGTSIPYVNSEENWAGMTSGAWCMYNHEENNKAAYGGLYNWYAVKTGKLCPTGWHVPSDNEWKQLEITLGMDPEVANLASFRGTDQGTQMKSPTGWISDTSGTNSSGFTAIPGGYRFESFIGIGRGLAWWSSTEESAGKAWDRGLNNENLNVDRYAYEKHYGFSIRCVRD